MNINQKIASSSYLLSILILLITNLVNAQNSVHHQAKKNIFHELYQLYIPKKISATQIGIFCYTIFKTICLGTSINKIKNIVLDRPLGHYDRNWCFVLTVITCLLSESIYKDYKNLYAQKNNLTEKPTEKPTDPQQNSDNEPTLDTDINTDSDSIINVLEFSS